MLHTVPCRIPGSSVVMVRVTDKGKWVHRHVATVGTEKHGPFTPAVPQWANRSLCLEAEP